MDLHLDDIVLTYPDGEHRLTAVDHTSLTIRAGTTTALLGPSGSGKSSLLAVAAGLTRPDHGNVSLGDEVVLHPRTSIKDATLLRRRRIGIVFQQPQLIDSLTAVEQIELRDHIVGRRSRQTRARAMELLDAVGLTAQAHHRPAQLSGGQRQRVAIARALWGQPEALLVDEPTSALDHERGVLIVELITRLARESNAAALLVSHDASTLGSVDDEAHLVDGRIVAAADAA